MIGHPANSTEAKIALNVQPMFRTQTESIESVHNDFKKFFYSQFVEAMLVPSNASGSEKDFGGTIWRSVLADAFASKLIFSNELAVSSRIKDAVNAYSK